MVKSNIFFGVAPVGVLALIVLLTGITIITYFGYRLPELASVAILLAFVSLTVLPFLRNLRSSEALILFTMAALLVVYVFSYLSAYGIRFNSEAIRRIYVMAIVFSGVVVGYAATLGRNLDLAGRVAKWGGIAALGVLGIMLILKGHGLAAKNVVGGISIHLAFLATAGHFVINKNKAGLAVIVLPLTLIAAGVLANQRMLVGLGVAVGLALPLMLLDKTKVASYLVLLASAAFAVFIVLFIVNLRTSDFISDLRYLSVEWTGRRLESGRDILWPRIVEAAKHSPVFGLGPAALPDSYTGVALSSHNSFLQTLLQAGYAGLAAIIVILAALGLVLVRSKVHSFAALGALYVAVVVVHNSFEVVLTQNVFAICCATWITFGYFLGLSRLPSTKGEADISLCK